MKKKTYSECMYWVTGGAGYIGSVVVEELLQDKHHLVYHGCRVDQKGNAMRLRERGIYSLPNGRELVVIGNTPTGNVEMCGPQGFQCGEYLLDSRGRLLTDGKPTAWDINNLTDTGRTATELSHIFVANRE